MSESVSILLLFIEDDPALGELFSLMLRREAKKRGWTMTVEWVQTLADGFARAKRIPPPDLIILDLGLTDSMPMQTITRIPELEKYGPVHVLTGRSESDVREAVARLGVSLSDKREAFGSILENGIATLIRWLPKSHRAHERETRFRALHEINASLQAPPIHGPD